MTKIHETAFIAPGAVVLGNVTVEEECGVWFHAVIRGEREGIFIAKGSNIQDNCVIHVTEGFPVYIGSGVTVGHGAILHGCIVEENSLIGMGAILLNGCHIGKDCIIGAGALVTGGTVIPDGSLVLGNPGRIVRRITEEEIEKNRQNAERYVAEAKNYMRQLQEN